MANSDSTTGAELVAWSLRDLGITTVFGLTGYPITGLLEHIINIGIKFIGFRNEQAASYAATAYGYLTGKPGCCIVVGGPGVIHAMAGAINSSGNCFPLVLLAGSCETYSVGKGTFQELDAVSLLSPHVKLALRPHGPQAISSTITRAYQASWYGRPGTGFVDLPSDYLTATFPRSDVLRMSSPLPPPVLPSADDAKVSRIAQLIKSASAPLVVIGKGSAYAHAETSIRALINSTQIPFLPTPMGKGAVPDAHPCNATSARSTALRSADVVLVLAARLNWILHFGESPKWNAAARVVQIDIDADSIGQNAGDAELGMVADVGTFASRLLRHLGPWQYGGKTPFRDMLDKEKTKNEAVLAKAARLKAEPLKFEHAFHVMRESLYAMSPRSECGIVYVSEGARTMDTSRAWFFQDEPRLRLDAGSHGTMGVGFAYLIAAWEAYNGPHAEACSGKKARKKIVGIMGDSASGFAAMEIETMARCGMDCLIFVMNNGGVYHGHADTHEEWLAQQRASNEGRGPEGFRSWSLGWETRYDMLAEAVGGKGYLVRTSEELQRATKEGFQQEVPVIVNVLVESGKGAPAVFGFDLPKEEMLVKAVAKL